MFIEFVAADISHLCFRSDKDDTNNGLGFMAYMVCFKPEDNNLTGMIKYNDIMLKAKSHSMKDLYGIRYLSIYLKPE